jgi:hypothetical protein
MKVKDLVQMVTTNYDSEDEVIVLIYSKDTFDYPEDDEMESSGGLDPHDQHLSNVLSEMSSEYAEIVSE